MGFENTVFDHNTHIYIIRISTLLQTSDRGNIENTIYSVQKKELNLSIFV